MLLFYVPAVVGPIKAELVRTDGVVSLVVSSSSRSFLSPGDIVWDDCWVHRRVVGPPGDRDLSYVPVSAEEVARRILRAVGYDRLSEDAEREELRFYLGPLSPDEVAKAVLVMEVMDS